MLSRVRNIAGALSLTIAFAAAITPAAEAAQRRRPAATAVKKPVREAQAAAAAPRVNPRYSHIVIDAATGAVLSEDRADEVRHQASLVKIMTLLMTFDALKEGRLTLSQPLTASARAAAASPTEIGIRAGQAISVEDAILALTVHSANDAAIILAEAIGGSEARFAGMMNDKARDLGLTKTNFTNASGLPQRDARGRLLPDQNTTTARDMALLCQALVRDYGPYYHFFSAREFTYRNKVYKSHNYLLTGDKGKKIEAYDGLDGIKTGYIRASGYNLAASAARPEGRVIAVVFGSPSDVLRAAAMRTLLDRALESLKPPAPQPPPHNPQPPPP